MRNKYCKVNSDGSRPPMYICGRDTYDLSSSNAMAPGDALLGGSNPDLVMEYLSNPPKSSIVPNFTTYRGDKHATDLTHTMDTMIVHSVMSNHTANSVQFSPDPIYSTLNEPHAGSG